MRFNSSGWKVLLAGVVLVVVAVAQSWAAPQYNIRVWGPGVPTREAPADITAGPDVVNFAY